MLDDPEDVHRRLPEEARLAVQLHRSGATAPRRAGGHRAEAAAARLSQCRGARPAGGRRCAGRAALVHHRAAGHRCRAPSGFRLSGRGLSAVLRLRRHPARKPPRPSWRIEFLDYLLRPAVSARIVEATRTATANAVRARFSPRVCPPHSESLSSPEVFDRGEWPRTLTPPPSASATASGRKSNRHSGANDGSSLAIL